MGSGGASVPPPPQMSAEERFFLNQQGLTLQQLGGMLGDASLQQQETQNVLKNLSGLYDVSDVAEVQGSSSIKANVLNDLSFMQGNSLKLGGFVRGVNDTTKRLYDAGLGGLGYNEIISRLNSSPQAYSSFMDITKGTPASKKYTINEEKLGDLRKRMADYQTKADELAGLETARYERALRGDLPVSEGTQQRKAQEFNLLRENLARQGSLIQGETPETAVGLSSAAAQNLGEFQRTYKLIEDAERHGELAAGGMGPTPGALSLGYMTGAQNYSPASLIPGYGSLASAYGGAAQPYAAQRGLQYQSAYQNAALRNQGIGGLSSLLGYGGSAAIMAGNPLLGAGLMGAGYLNSLR